MTPLTSAVMQESTGSAPAPAPRFQLKSPRSLSRLKAMRQSANSTRHTPQDQHPPLPAVSQAPFSLPLDLLNVAPVQERRSSPKTPSPWPSFPNAETSGADAGPDKSLGSERLTLPRLASLEEVRGAGFSPSPQASSSSATGLSRSSVDTTTNDSDPLTASSTDSTPRTSPSSSHRDLKESQAASAELWSGGSSTMEGHPGDQAYTPPRQCPANGRGHFSSPAGSAVRAMGRRLLRFRQSSANEPLITPLPLSLQPAESSRTHQPGNREETSHHPTATTPRQRDFSLNRARNDVGMPQLPPLLNVGPSVESRTASPSDRVVDASASRDRPATSLASDSARSLQGAFEILDALDAVMTLGTDEVQTMLSSQARSTGPATASSSTRAFSTWPHATDDFAPPRLLTEAQMAQLEEEERSRRPRNILSRFSLSSRFNRQSRPNSTVSSVSEDDYGGDDDARRSESRDAHGGFHSARASYREALTSMRRSNSSSASSPDACNRNDSQPSAVRSIITPGPTPRRSLPGLDSPAKRALHHCTLLKAHPQLAHLFLVSLCRGWPTSDDRGNGHLEILYPRSVNTVARLKAAGRRGGSQLGVTGAPITPTAREKTIEVGHRHVMRKLRFHRLDREEMIEIGFFMKDYASHYISGDVVLRAMATRPQVSPEALARPPGAEQTDHDGRASVSTFGSASGRTSTQTRAEVNMHGLALWAARKPFLERCAMIRGDIGTTFDVGDIVVDSGRATTVVPTVDAGSPKPGRPSYSLHLKIQAGLIPPFGLPMSTDVPLRRADRAARGVSRMPPPWIAPRASAENLSLRANAQPLTPEQQEQPISVPMSIQPHGPLVHELEPTFPHASRQRDNPQGTAGPAEPRETDTAHRRTCSQTSVSSTDDSFQSAASSLRSSLDEQDEDDVPIADLFERRRSSLGRHGNGRSSSSTETLAAPPSSATSPPSSPPPQAMYRRASTHAASPSAGPSQVERGPSRVQRGEQRESQNGSTQRDAEPDHRSEERQSDVVGPSGTNRGRSRSTPQRLSHQLPGRAAGDHTPLGVSVDSIHRAFMLSSSSASSSQRDLGGASREANRTSDTVRRHSHQPSPTRPHMTRRRAYNEERAPPAAPSAQLAHQVNNAALMRPGNSSHSTMASGGSHRHLTGANYPPTPPRAGVAPTNGLPTTLSFSPFNSSSSSPSPAVGRDAPRQVVGVAQPHSHASNGVQPRPGRPTQPTALTQERSAVQQRRESRGGGSTSR